MKFFDKTLCTSLALTMWIGCAQDGEHAREPLETAAGEQGADGDESAKSDEMAKAERDAITIVESQDFELEPGHTLSVQRMADDSLVLAEVGSIDDHEQKLTDDSAVRSVGDTIHALLPKVKIRERLLLPRKPFVRREISPPPTLDEESSAFAQRDFTKAAPRSSDTFAPQAAGSATDFALLRCSDPGITNCLLNRTTTAVTPFDVGGYYRGAAVNRASSTNATFRLEVLNQLTGAVTTVGTPMTLGPRQWGRLHHLPIVSAAVRASVTGNAGTLVSVSSIVTSIGPRAQENPNWCWIATAHMAISNWSNPAQQCEEANRHWNRSDCCTNPAGCDGGGEAMQVLKARGYAFNSIDSNDTIALGQALQNGPVIFSIPGSPGHYTVMSDYREVWENNAWVPYGFYMDPAPAQNYSQEAHVSWRRLRQIGNRNGGREGGALTDIIPAGGFQISRVSWHPTTQRINIQTGRPGPLAEIAYDVKSIGGDPWINGLRSYNDTWDVNGLTITPPISVGAWAWFTVSARACNLGSCGAWTSRNSVSLVPNVSITSLQWSGTTLSAQFTADPAPQETVYRYRFLDTTVAPAVPLRAWKIGGTRVNEFSSRSSASLNVGAVRRTRFQVQACSHVGCSAWAERDSP